MLGRMSVDVDKRRFTADEYQRTGEAGIFSPEDRVELIDGEILTMSPIGSPHAGAVNRANRTLVIGTQGRALVAVQNPVRLNAFSEPEPDLVLLRPRDDFYRSSHPQPQDVLLIIEISESTLRYDRDFKGPLYARNGIVEYWLVDLTSETVTCHSRPENGVYRDAATFHRGQMLMPKALPNFIVAVDDLLG
jgi:Uma2 family endonuclease